MALKVFVNFNGDCRQAVTFYAKVFQMDKPTFMTYGEAPPDPAVTFDEAEKNLIMYTDLSIAGSTVMFSDVLPGMPLTKGDNISLTVVTKDKEEIGRLFRELGEGGEVVMELMETFWSDLYGMVTDKFGINWQLSHESGKEYGNG